MNRSFDPKETIPAFDRYLESKNISFTAIAVGGAALSILGIISRGTGDLDLLETSIPRVFLKRGSVMKNKEINLTLEERLSAIGIMISTRPLTKVERDSVDIEETLSEAFVAIGNDENYFRYLSPLFSWIEIHADSVIVEKLLKINKRLQNSSSDLSLFSLAACFGVKCGFRNWARLLTISEKESRGAVFGPRDLAESLLQLRGEEEWAKKCGVRLPKGVLTTNSKWALSKEALARTNRQYRNRLIYGPQWRADIINALELGARTPAEASRISGASYEPCHRVLKELTAAGKIRPNVHRQSR